MTTTPTSADAATPVNASGLLASICGPDDLSNLDAAQLSALADELRTRLIEEVTATGGHLGPSLGALELIIALHVVFRSPHDALIFDTGHQAYAHKMLTGRADGFATLRTRGGLSGYPSRAESRHDWVENSHASGSLAYATGLATAMQLRGETDRRVVAVIGDGALTGGVALEGLNNLGNSSLPVIIVINDNGRSYGPTTGALAQHLSHLRDGGSRDGNWFTAWGFEYLGPVDGHDLAATCAVLRQAATSGRPVVVHVVTQKGHGYGPAESDEADRMHACGVVDAVTGRPATPSAPTWTQVFEQELAALARRRPDIVASTAAMRLPTGLGALSRDHPDRVFDSGIAEQHLLASAAGQAAGGLHPVVAVYSTFLSRAFDQLLYDIGLHHLPVTLVLDRAGITGPDGPSHHGLWDLALLIRVPGMRIACPRDPARLRELLHEATDICGPTALRFPKAAATVEYSAQWRMDGIDVLYRSRGLPLDVLLIALGPTAGPCLDAAEELTERGYGITVIDPRWAFPLNPALPAIIARHRAAVCVEDGLAHGGIGSHLLHTVAERSPQAPAIQVLGVPTEFVPHATRDELLAHYGLTGPGIAADCLALLRTLPESQ
ncbi:MULTISPECIES: 1-deoxy-D-xylulose-5-phosphate synthase [Nocardia]|uniref:1-deoxy-D-xylulose-5-phosphate synthase n=1 Tax=Nocardia TaxID=1817 RepID=UPI002456B1B8|nr:MULTISPECIES: 1-deoxy-D-xylulose-5-phosphate synthase [Nocardia]